MSIQEAFKEFYQSLLDSKEAEKFCKKGAAEIRQFVRFVNDAGEDNVFDYMTETIMAKENISRRQASGIANEDFNALVRLVKGEYDFEGNRDA